MRDVVLLCRQLDDIAVRIVSAETTRQDVMPLPVAVEHTPSGADNEAIIVGLIVHWISLSGSWCWWCWRACCSGVVEQRVRQPVFLSLNLLQLTGREPDPAFVVLVEVVKVHSVQV